MHQREEQAWHNSQKLLKNSKRERALEYAIDNPKPDKQNLHNDIYFNQITEDDDDLIESLVPGNYKSSDLYSEPKKMEFLSEIDKIKALFN